MKNYGPLLIAGASALLLLFGAIGGPAQRWDVSVIEWFAGLRQSSPGLTRAAIVLTQAGSAYGTIGAVVIGAGWLWRQRKRYSATLLLAAMTIERLTIDTLKFAYDRPRPSFDLHPVVTSGSSYPSGHAGNALTAFVLVALLVVPPSRRRLALGVAIPLALLVGLSRPFLGVHWPSDMLGGWAVACAALVIAAIIARHPSIAAEQKHQIVGRHGPPLDQA